jgi:hypothetical protein
LGGGGGLGRFRVSRYREIKGKWTGEK